MIEKGDKATEYIKKQIEQKKFNETKKNRIYKKIKIKKEKNIDMNWKDMFYMSIIFFSLLMIPFLSEKIVDNTEEKKEGIENVYDYIEKTPQEIEEEKDVKALKEEKIEDEH